MNNYDLYTLVAPLTMKDLDLVVSKRLSPPLYSSTHAEIIQ